MAPIKFEDNIREKLQERELTPSAKAWEKLEGRLNDKPSKNSKSYLWLGMAATITGILLVVSFLLNQDEITAVDGQLVEEKVEKATNEANSEEIKKSITSEGIKNEVIAVENTQNSFQSTEPLTVKTEEIENEAKKEQINYDETIKTNATAVAQIENTTKSMNKDVEKLPLHIEKSYEEAKIDEVVALIEKQNETITTEEIDALLANAQREIQSRKILDQGTAKINAADLLNDVEFELERSFRDRVFDALGDQFNKVRTAVSERNN